MQESKAGQGEWIEFSHEHFPLFHLYLLQKNFLSIAKNNNYIDISKTKL